MPVLFLPLLAPPVLLLTSYALARLIFGQPHRSRAN
jgi:hypothetical protein